MGCSSSSSASTTTQHLKVVGGSTRENPPAIVDRSSSDNTENSQTSTSTSTTPSGGSKERETGVASGRGEEGGRRDATAATPPGGCGGALETNIVVAYPAAAYPPKNPLEGIIVGATTPLSLGGERVGYDHDDEVFNTEPPLKDDTCCSESSTGSYDGKTGVFHVLQEEEDGSSSLFSAPRVSSNNGSPAATWSSPHAQPQGMGGRGRVVATTPAVATPTGNAFSGLTSAPSHSSPFSFPLSRRGSIAIEIIGFPGNCSGSTSGRGGGGPTHGAHQGGHYYQQSMKTFGGGGFGQQQVRHHHPHHTTPLSDASSDPSISYFSSQPSAFSRKASMVSQVESQLSTHRLPSVGGEMCEEPEDPVWWTEHSDQFQQRFSVDVHELQSHFSPATPALEMRVTTWDAQVVAINN